MFGWSVRRVFSLQKNFPLKLENITFRKNSYKWTLKLISEFKLDIKNFI